MKLGIKMLILSGALTTICTLGDALIEVRDIICSALNGGSIVSPYETHRR